MSPMKQRSTLSSTKVILISIMMCIQATCIKAIQRNTFRRSAFVTAVTSSPLKRYETSKKAIYHPLLLQATTRSSSTTTTTTTQNNAPSPNKKTPTTGRLRRLPVVKAPAELIDKARKTAKYVKADKAIKNAKKRAQKEGAETMDAITKALCVPLRDIVNGYKYEMKHLHPFEKVVADLTARARQKKDGLTLMDVLNEIHEARKEILLAGKDWTAAAKNADSAREASELILEGSERLYDLFNDLASSPVTNIIQLQKSLRTTPAVRLDTPAVVLVGAPNVGKSSIVRAISSATPEVNNYPFTTRGMTLGHVEVFWNEDVRATTSIIPDSDLSLEPTQSYAFSQLCQIMDSPGLLVRTEEGDRNEMESLTLAAMQHLPTAVMYVLDLSGEAGDKCSSVADQLQLRKEVRARFPRRPWIDVVSKIDLGLVPGAKEQLEDILDGTPYIELSIQENTGVDELKVEVMRMLGEVRVVLDAMAAVDERSARPVSSTDK